MAQKVNAVQLAPGKAWLMGSENLRRCGRRKRRVWDSFSVAERRISFYEWGGTGVREQFFAGAGGPTIELRE